MDLDYLKLLDEDAADAFMPTLQLAAAVAQTFFLYGPYILAPHCEWMHVRPAEMLVFPSTAVTSNVIWPLAVTHGLNQNL